MSTILLDFESRSLADLETLGGRLYWQHPSTRPICCWLYEVESATWALWFPGDPCPFGPDDVLAAHNMTGFDRFAVAAVGWRALDEGPPYIDTSEIARSAGLPGALDALAKRWLGREKNHAGNAVTRRLSGVKAPLRKAGEWEVPERIQALLRDYERAFKASGELPPIAPELLDYVVEYCRNDVEVLVEGWPEISSWLDADLPGVVATDRAVNDRGIQFDAELARALLREDARLKSVAIETCAAALECTTDEARDSAKSPKQFCAITGADNAQATTVASVDHPLARLRESLATIAAGKLEAALGGLCDDGRLRDILRYFAAHTGRWGGKRFQPQNLPRPDKRFEKWGDAEICELAARVIAGGECDQQEIDLLVRACLRAKPRHVLVWGDYSAVEGRGLAWAANDQPALDVYRSGRDPYVVDAMTIYCCVYEEALEKWRRTVGKVAHLALGFQGGEGAFANMARSLGVDLSGVDVPAVIKAWRAGRAPTVQFWHDLERAMIACVQFKRETSVGAFSFAPGDRGSVALVLPSGRAIIYWGVQVGAGFKGRPSLSYEGLHFREHLYGGKIAENAIQAMCRDILADALVRLERAGMPVVLHVHDEPVCEVPIARLDWAQATIGEIMTTLPAWAEGFPPKANIDHGFRYRK